MTKLLQKLLLGTLLFPAMGAESRQIPHSAAEWLTTADRSALLSIQARRLPFNAGSAHTQPTITIEDQHSLQTMDGFGFALTGGSAQLIMKMSPAARHRLLAELFSTKGAGIGVSYLRVSVGASDMNERVFTYDDLAPGQTDPELKHFDLNADLHDVVPVLQEILKIAPAIKILATPWSAPSWMKTNGDAKSGSLRPDCYEVYARYLATYLLAMQQHGIRIDAITPQNEPLNPKNTPSMVMTADEEAVFIGSALGPTLQKHHLRTKIISYDHNCDRPDYPLTVYANKSAEPYVDGAGFHLYEGTIDALTKVHNAYPDKQVYFTEQMVIDNPKHGPDLAIAGPEEKIVIGATASWSRNVLLWNLAADPTFGPHTANGGCPICEGAITLDGDAVARNVAYYTIAHISRFVRPGATRIASKVEGSVPSHVVFRNLDGSMVLLAANNTENVESFDVELHGLTMKADLTPGSVATYVWH